MYSRKVMTWLAAGIIGAGASSLYAQETQPGQQEEPQDLQVQVEVDQQQQDQQTQQLQKMLQDAMVKADVERQQAEKQAKSLAQKIQQQQLSQQQIKQEIQKALTEAGVAEQEAQQQAQQLARDVQQWQQQQRQAQAQQPEQELDQVFGIERRDQQRQQQATGEMQTITGQVVDLEAYLMHGDRAAQSPMQVQASLDQSDPVAILTNEGELYLVLDRHEASAQTDIFGYGREAQPQDQQQQRQQQFGQDAFEIQEGEVIDPQQHEELGTEPAQQQEENGLGLLPEEEELEQPGEFGLGVFEEEGRQQQAADQAAQTEQREQQAGDVETEEIERLVEGEQPMEQEEGQVFGFGRVDPTFEQVQQPEQQRQQKPLTLEAGEQVTLTGPVYTRGELKGIVVSGYTIRGEQSPQSQQQMQQGQQGQLRVD